MSQVCHERLPQPAWCRDKAALCLFFFLLRELQECRNRLDEMPCLGTGRGWDGMDKQMSSHAYPTGPGKMQGISTAQ